MINETRLCIFSHRVHYAGRRWCLVTFAGGPHSALSLSRSEPFNFSSSGPEGGFTFVHLDYETSFRTCIINVAQEQVTSMNNLLHVVRIVIGIITLASLRSFTRPVEVTAEHVEWQKALMLLSYSITHWLTWWVITQQPAYVSAQGLAQSWSKQPLAELEVSSNLKGPDAPHCVAGFFLPLFLFWSLLLQISWRLQSESVNLISQQGVSRGEEECFPPTPPLLHCPHSRPLLCPPLTIFPSSYSSSSFSSHPQLPVSLGWAPAPTVSQQSKHRGLTLPLLSCFSLISCCYSLRCDSR